MKACLLAVGLIVVGLFAAGCATDDNTKSAHYPVTTMQDPVTETTPNVITNR